MDVIFLQYVVFHNKIQQISFHTASHTSGTFWG